MSAPGWSTKDPDFLCPCIRNRYDRFMSLIGLWVTVLETARDMKRQEYYKSIGASRTLRSKHLIAPKVMDDKGALAFDVAPTEYLYMKAWNPNGPLWKAMGKIGKSVGLQWGGELWAPGFIDKPHFQLERCQCDAKS